MHCGPTFELLSENISKIKSGLSPAVFLQEDRDGNISSRRAVPHHQYCTRESNERDSWAWEGRGGGGQVLEENWSDKTPFCHEI